MAKQQHLTPSKGKRRELRMRDTMYLDAARKIALQEGFSNLTLARLAAEVGFSKATLYQRFSSREELIVRLGLRCHRELLEIMSRGVGFDGPPRARMMAVGAAVHCYADLYAGNMRILAAIDEATIAGKVSQEHRDELAEVEVSTFQVMLGIIQDGVAAGDLQFRGGRRPESLCYALWVLVDGWAAALRETGPMSQIDTNDPFAEVLLNVDCLLDGYDWRPLSSEMDYIAYRNRVRASLTRQMEAEKQSADSPR